MYVLQKELLEGVHNFKNSGGNTFKLAMYTNSASFMPLQLRIQPAMRLAERFTTGGASLWVDPTTSSTTALQTFQIDV